MTCGDVHWWQQPDFTGLLQRHGLVEHLIIQVDFARQVQRAPWSEFSIPAASKTLDPRTLKPNGRTGFADIVSLATREIWEIKPHNLEKEAHAESGHYAAAAVAACGPGWHRGDSYTTSAWATRKYGPDIVYRVQAPKQRWELVVRQVRDGCVLYQWHRNGKSVEVLPRAIAWAVRGAVISQFFPHGRQAAPLPGARSPDAVPPVKFKPPVFAPGACIPQFAKHLVLINKSLWTTCARTVPEGSTVSLLLNPRVADAVVGPGRVAWQRNLMKVSSPDPSLTAYRHAVATLTAAGLSQGVVGLVLAGLEAAPVLLEAAALVGGAILVGCEVGAPATVTSAVATGGLLGSLASGFAVDAIGIPVAVGAALIVLAVPRVSAADTDKPVGFDVSVVRFSVNDPGSRAPSVGESAQVDGAEWLVAGVAVTLPDTAAY